MSKDNSGPAFPVEGHFYGTTLGGQLHHGMTLRDYFAAKAMQALLSNPKLAERINREGGAYGGWIEESAWSWADAMLKERNK